MPSRSFAAADRAVWRAWLEEHHATAREVWLLIGKKGSGVASLTLDEAVEEALCFGWIDGGVRRHDARRYALRMTPRRPDSVWSESNKARVRRLTRAGRMTPAGLALVAAGKRSGQWRRAAERERIDGPPPDLAAVLAACPAAAEGFAALVPSHRKMYIAWILDAKRPETRARRVQKVVTISAGRTDEP